MNKLVTNFLNSRPYRIRFILFSAITLIIISILCISFTGRIYVYNYSDPSLSTSQNLRVSLENAENTDPNLEVIEIIEQKVSKDTLSILLRGKNRGATFVDVFLDDELKQSDLFFVHAGNVITKSTFFGDTNGDLVFPIVLAIFLSILILSLIQSYRTQIHQSIYQYKNITRLGLIIFLSFTLLVTITHFFVVGGLEDIISASFGLFSTFSIILLPLVFILSFLVIIGSIVLSVKEGFSWQHFLGFIFGLFLLFTTFVPEIINQILQSSTFIDVHNSRAFITYFLEFLQTAIYISLTYIEIIFIATIIITIKVTRRHPSNDQDYLIILGCYIFPNGTPGGLLQKRLDRAISFAKQQQKSTHKLPVFVCSGGQGSDEPISEAESMKNYLIAHKIPSTHIILEDKSTTTTENLHFSTRLIKKHSSSKHPKVTFVTSNYHVFRAGYLATSLGFKNYSGLGAKTKLYFWQGAFIREFVAEIILEKTNHIFTILILDALSLLAYFTIYFSETI